MKKLFYRVANTVTNQGLWYDSEGNFTGLIHNEFSFCMNKDLPMPYDTEIKGWLSVTDTLDTLFLWFSEEDISRLEEHGYFITIYEADNYKDYQNHQVICQNSSTVKEIIKLKNVLASKVI